MLKKICILFLSLNVCAADDIKKPESSVTNSSSMQTIGLGLADLAVYVIIPNMREGSGVATLAGAATSVYAIYTLGGIINESINPSEDKKVRAAEAHKKYKILMAEEEFRSCLMNNAYKPRNASGIPTECEDLAHMYARTAGKSERDEMIALFKETYEN